MIHSFQAPPPSLPWGDSGVMGGVAATKSWVQEGQNSRSWVLCTGCPKCAACAYPCPPPASQGLAHLLLLLRVPRLCNSAMGYIVQMSGSTNLERPTLTPNSPANLMAVPSFSSKPHCTAQLAVAPMHGSHGHILLQLGKLSKNVGVKEPKLQPSRAGPHKLRYKPFVVPLAAAVEYP